MAAVLVVLFVLGGTVYLVGFDWISANTRPTGECSATRKIEVFDILRPEDLYCGPATDGTSAARATAARTLLENHYALVPLEPDAPIALHDVGPQLPDDFTEYVLISIRGGSSLALDGRLHRGTRVDLVLTPQSADSQLPTLQDNLVLDIRPAEPGVWVITLGTRATLDQASAKALSEGHALVIMKAR